MFRIQAPVIVVRTAEAREALGDLLGPASRAAYREIAVAVKGLEIAHLQFVFRGLILAVCSRVRRSGAVEIELGLGDPRLPTSTFTSKQLRDAEAAARARIQAAQGGLRWRRDG